MMLHYFLADDTVEILEKIHPNTGRDGIPVFLKRDRLPKVGIFGHLLSHYVTSSL